MGGAASSPTSVPLSRRREGVVIKELAKGGFSTVLLVECEGELFAAKRVTAGKSHEAERDALREIAAHNAVGGSKPVSPFVVALVESSVSLADEGKVITLVFPFFKQGALATLLANADAPLPEARALHFFACVCDALAAIHALGVAHLDVKTHNLMLRGDDAVLIDLGSSTGPPATTPCATAGQRTFIKEAAERFSSAAYRAPELWELPFAATVLDYRCCDVFAAGCVLHACLFPPLGFTPFESPSQGLLSLAARTASFRFPDVPVSGGIKELVARCLDVDAAKRPCAVDASAECRALRDLVDFSADFGA